MSEKKIALITGANRGIGFETARQLAKQGIKVLIGSRSEDKGKEAESKLKNEGLDVEYIKLDVNDRNTHASAEKFINNAGIFLNEFDNGAPIPASQTKLDIFRETFETNFFNTIALTQQFVPLVKKSDAGRIVFLSSGLGSLSLHSDPKSPIYNFKVPAYDISKTALNGYAVHLAYELRDTHVKVNAAHPGSVVTDMNANGEIQVEEGAKTSVDLATLPADGYSGRFVHLGQELPW